MPTDWILFFILAAISVASALGMLLSRNAVYSALYLILNFITIAIFFLLLGGPFLAMVQITVYAGAIMVLFLFVIMLLGAERLGLGQTLAWQRPLAILLALALMIETGYVVFTRGDLIPAGDLPLSSFGSPMAIGEVLFNRFLLPFEVISVLLLIAMIGAIVLTKDIRKRP